MALDTTQQIDLGPSILTLGSTDLGHSGEKGVIVHITTHTVDGHVNVAGPTAVNTWKVGDVVEVDVEVAQTDPLILSQSIAAFLKVTSSGGASKNTLGSTSGLLLTPHQLTIHPKNQGTSKTFDTTIYAAVPISSPQIVYDGAKVQGWACKFRAQAVTTRGEGDMILAFGDPTITADTVAPTFTIVPADDATVTAVTQIVMTLSKPMDGRFVNLANFKLIQWSGAVGTTPTLIDGASVALVNNGASTTITWTPASSPLTGGGKVYSFLGFGLVDQNGNPLQSGNPYLCDFTVNP